MNAVRYDCPELVGFRIDSPHSKPASDTAGTTDNTLSCNTCLDVRDIDTDLNESFCKNVSEITSTEIVVSQAPQVAYWHDSCIVNTDPRTVVKLMNRRRHGITSGLVATNHDDLGSGYRSSPYLMTG